MAQCENNLKQLGLAIHNYHQLFNCIPFANSFDIPMQDPFRPTAPLDGLSGKGWIVAVLPQLEQQALYDQFGPASRAISTAEFRRSRGSNRRPAGGPEDEAGRAALPFRPFGIAERDHRWGRTGRHGSVADQLSGRDRRRPNRLRIFPLDPRQHHGRYAPGTPLPEHLPPHAELSGHVLSPQLPQSRPVQPGYRRAEPHFHGGRGRAGVQPVVAGLFLQRRLRQLRRAAESFQPMGGPIGGTTCRSAASIPAGRISAWPTVPCGLSAT